MSTSQNNPSNDDSNVIDDSNESEQMSGMIYFFSVTVVYLIIVIAGIYSSSTFKDVDNNSNNTIYNIIYIGALIIGTYIFNMATMRSICSDQVDYTNVLFITILPWTLIFSIIYIILEVFRGWVTPFSNTIGYFIVKLFGIEEELSRVLAPKSDGDNSRDPKNADIAKAINNVTNNKSKFINQIESSVINFQDFFTELKKSGMLKLEISEKLTDKSQFDNIPDILRLFKMIRIKYLIGKACWYILSGALILSITNSFIINSSCQRSAKDLEKRYTKLNLQSRMESEKYTDEIQGMTTSASNLSALTNSASGGGTSSS